MASFHIKTFFFFLLAFFSVQGLFEGKSVNDIKDKLASGYTTALIGNYKV
jgi:protein Mpv17